MNKNALDSFWDLTLRNFRTAWDKIASNNKEADKIKVSSDIQGSDYHVIVGHMKDCLDGKGGEVSARKRAAELGRTYLSLSNQGRKKFLQILSNEFGTDKTLIDAAVANLNQKKAPSERFLAEQTLRQALKAPRVDLLKQFNALPEGVKFLVDLRAELILLAREDESLKGLEVDLRDLLSSWFDVGFLELKQITWDASASLLEKFFTYEAVHEIIDWDDLKNRLAADRRCFAYFHPRMPYEPLIFVWVALVDGVSDNIADLLDKDAPLVSSDKANTAIFYSISNAQIGLSGINFGNFLIKRVVDSLSKELPNITSFATLSPIPGFKKWLSSQSNSEISNLLSDDQVQLLVKSTSEESVMSALEQLLSRKNWHLDEKLLEVLREPLIRLAAHFILFEKRSGCTAADSVAHFHLNNGARLHRFNWLADLSPRGLSQSYGIMLNYLYDLKTIDSNHEAYRTGRPVMLSKQVDEVLKG